MSVEGRLKYRKWIRESDQWETERLYALGFDQMKCQGCEKIDPSNHAHHIFYPNSWNDTKRRHLRVLCKDCHKRIHELTTPHLYRTIDEARQDFFTACNEIRESHNLDPMKHPHHTIEGSNRREEALANRKRTRLMDFCEELDNCFI